MANFDPYRIQTPQPIAKKIATVDYARETNRYANLGANSSTGGLLGKWVKYNIKLFLNTFLHTHIYIHCVRKKVTPVYFFIIRANDVGF